MENLENSWNLKMVISRPGKVIEKNVIPKVWELMEMLLYPYVH